MIYQRGRTTCSFKRALHSYLRTRTPQRGACNRLKTIRTISGIVGERNIDIRNGSLIEWECIVHCERQRIEDWPRTEKVRPEESLHQLLDCSFRSFRTRGDFSPSSVCFLSASHARVGLFSLICLTNCSRSYQTFPSFSLSLVSLPSVLALLLLLLAFVISAWSRHFQGHGERKLF